MSKKEKVLISAAGALLIVCTVAIVSIFFGVREVPVLNGSVIQASEYQSTSTRNFDGTGLSNLTVLSGSAGSVGSVVVTGAAAGVINLFDATTSSVLLRNNISTSTIFIGQIPASAAAGNYIFDRMNRYGLLVEFIGTAPTSTITWR